MRGQSVGASSLTLLPIAVTDSLEIHGHMLGGVLMGYYGVVSDEAFSASPLDGPRPGIEPWSDAIRSALNSVWW